MGEVYGKGTVRRFSQQATRVYKIKNPQSFTIEGFGFNTNIIYCLFLEDSFINPTTNAIAIT